MAISGVSSPSYRDQYEANGGIYADLDKTDETGESESTGKVWNAVFEDKKSSAIDTDSFLALIVAQMTNQDFMNPMDDTAMVTQMVQMNTMQMMQEMATQTKTSYVMGMVGKTVTAARINVSGELLKETGPVQKVTLTNNEFAVYVNGKRFTLEQIMEIGTSEGLSGADGADKTEDPDGTDKAEEELAQKKEYLNSLLGREVSITVKDRYGSYNVDGVVEKVSTKDGNFQVYVNGNWYDLDSVTEVGGKVESSSGSTGSTDSTDSGSTGSTDSSSSTGDTNSGGSTGSVDSGDNTTEDVNPDEKVDQDAPVEGEDTDNDITDEDDDQAVDETQTVE